MKKIIMLILLLTTLTGCSSEQHGFKKADDELKNHFDIAKVPAISGLEVGSIFLNIDKGTQEGIRNTVVITYTDKKGEIVKDVDTDSDVSVLYGPYEGKKVLTLSISKVKVDYGNEMQTKNIDNLELLYTKVQDNLLIYTRHNELSYTSEAQITNEYTQEQYFKMFAQAVKNN
ncbi:lipoprotein [Paenibacillus sp. FSL R7-0179]|uniref:lipoprotein n=1 Tax=Paenibacillus sp. FSL R7-0179 TaxID=2921672 RepID=UPI0030F8E205